MQPPSKNDRTSRRSADPGLPGGIGKAPLRMRAHGEVLSFTYFLGVLVDHDISFNEVEDGFFIKEDENPWTTGTRRPSWRRRG